MPTDIDQLVSTRNAVAFSDPSVAISNSGLVAIVATQYNTLPIYGGHYSSNIIGGVYDFQGNSIYTFSEGGGLERHRGLQLG